MKKLISSFMVLLLVAVFSVNVRAAVGDLFVQVDLRDGPGDDQCSILKVMPDGTFTEFVSFTTILALTGLTDCDFDETGLAVADNGDVYFAEDESDSAIMATPAGALSTFVSEAAIIAVTGEESANLGNGMVIGPDGDLYFNDQESDSILKATIPGGVVSLVLTEAQIIAVTGNSEAHLEGGIAFDCFGNLYITDSVDEGNDQESILILTPAGVLSIFVTEQEINNATGFENPDLDGAMTFFDSLFVNEDGNCDCVLEVKLNGSISVFVSEAQMTAVTGNDDADVDGGNAVNQMRQVFIGDDGDNPDDPNVLMSSPNGSSVSIVVSTQELEDFYAPDFGAPRLKGSMAFEGVNACQISQIPTLSEWGLIAMALVLGIVGFIAVRRRMVKA